LSSALILTLDKEFFLKNKRHFAECPDQAALGKEFTKKKKEKKEKKALPSAYSRTLGKPPSGIRCRDGEALGKEPLPINFSRALFAECKGPFAECPWHLAKRPDPVVSYTMQCKRPGNVDVIEFEST
jgi:hypothetical protein